MKRQIISIIACKPCVVLTAVIALLLCACHARSAENVVLSGLVSDVYDGDTIKIGKEHVRLIGVDTPEMNVHDTKKGPDCFAREAKDFLIKKISGKYVKIVSDPKTSTRDKYGRLLGYVYHQNEFINVELIKSGMAYAYTYFPFSKSDEFVKLHDHAKENKTGMWDACLVNCRYKFCKTGYK